MIKHPITRAIALAFATFLTLSGCDHFSNITAEEYIQRAKDMQSKGDLEGSILELKNAIQKDSNNAQPYKQCSGSYQNTPDQLVRLCTFVARIINSIAFYHNTRLFPH